MYKRQGSGDRFDHTFEAYTRNCVHFDFYRLTFPDVGGLSFFIIGDNPDVVGVDDIDKCLPGLDQLAFLDIFPAGSTVAGGGNHGVRKV